MPIDVRCPDGHQLSAPDRMAGKTIRCPTCSKLILVQAPSNKSEPVEPEPEVEELEIGNSDEWDDLEPALPLRRSRKKTREAKEANEESSPNFQWALMGATVLVCGLVGLLLGAVMAPSAQSIVTISEPPAAIEPAVSGPTDPQTAGPSNVIADKPSRDVSQNLRMVFPEPSAAKAATNSPANAPTSTTPANVRNGIPQRNSSNSRPANSPPMTNPRVPPSAQVAINQPSRANAVVQLPGTIKTVVFGGSGKYLIATVPEAKQVVVVDVVTKKSRTIYFRNSDLLVAAGETKLIVVDRTGGSISRYHLATLQRELTISCESFHAIAMGSSSEGPLLAVGNEVLQLNPQTFDAIPVTVMQRSGKDFNELAASANGQLFTAWQAPSPNGITTMNMVGDRLEASNDFDTKPQDHIDTPPLPSADGQVIHTHFGRRGAERQRLGKNDGQSEHIQLPAITGPYYVGFDPRDPHQGNSDFPMQFYLYCQNSDTKLATITNVEMPERDGPVPTQLRHRFFVVPVADSIVTVSKNRLVFQRFNIKEELEKPGVATFFVSSTPPTSVARGGKLSYNVEVFPAKGTSQFSLDSGPQGMTISKTGTIEWKVPDKFRNENVTAVINVTGAAGTKATQELNLAITDPPKTKPRTTTTAKAVTVPPGPPLNSQGDQPLLPLPARTVDRVVFPMSMQSVVPAGSGKYLMMYSASEKQIFVLDVVSKTLSPPVIIEDNNAMLVAGETKFVVMQPTKGTISRYDLSSQKEELTVKCESYIALAMGSSSEGPLFAVNKPQPIQITGTALNLETLQPTGPEVKLPSRMHNATLSASANAKLFACWTTRQSPEVAAVLEFEGDTPRWSVLEDKAGPLFPSADGRVVYGLPGKYTPTLQPFGRPVEGLPQFLPVPASTGPLTLALVPQTSLGDPRPKPLQLRVLIQNSDDPLVTMTDIESPDVSPSFGAVDMQRNHLYQRFFLLPVANVLAILSPKMDQVRIYRFDLKEELERAGVDYFVVTSSPNINVIPGKDITHQLEVLSKRGNVHFELQNGPNGLIVTKTGVISWKPPAILAAKELTAKVLITDDSQREITHILTLLNRQPKK